MHTLGKGGKDLIPVEKRRKQSEDGRKGLDNDEDGEKGEDENEDEDDEDEDDDDSAPLQLTKVRALILIEGIGIM